MADLGKENDLNSRPMEYICFKLDDQEFGIPITQVKEIIHPPPITHVVHTTDLIRGVINIRGVIIAVLNIKKLFDLQQRSDLDTAKIIIVQHDDKIAGILIDTIEVVKEVKASDITKIEGTNEGAASYCDGVVQLDDHPLTIINVGRIIGAPELKQYQFQE